MSRLRLPLGQGWLDQGPSGYRPEPRRYVHGALVTSGRLTGRAPYIAPTPLTGEALAEARRRFHPHGNGRQG